MDRSGDCRRILLGEGEPEVRNFLSMALRCHGYTVECAEDGNEVLNYLRSAGANVSALLLDIDMPRKDGLETLREIRSIDRDLPVIMLSSAASPVTVVEAIKSGANDFLGKPVGHQELCTALERAMDGCACRTVTAAPSPADHGGTESFIAVSPEMRRVRTILQQIGASDVPVLVQGPTGAGKEVVARQLHVQSRRAQKPFVKLNCAALPAELVESELFGYERGAFTGAFQKKAGMFELADRGTLLLDEIGDMDIKLQAKLLQVLQDQEFQHLGGRETVRVDVRVISATHQDLEKAVEEGRFREDLYYRLNIIRLEIPPLCQRQADILPLAQSFLKKHALAGVSVPPVAPVLAEALLQHLWPGNVRELENAMRRYLVLQDPKTLIEDLRRRPAGHVLNFPKITEPEATASASAGNGALPVLLRVNEARKEVESEAIISALYAARWNRKQAAEILNIDYKALLYKMRKLSITNRGTGGSNGVLRKPAASADSEPAQARQSKKVLSSEMEAELPVPDRY